MLYFALFLHFYQPPTQFPQITKKIAKESYEKILKLLRAHQDAHLTVNFSASLTEQLVELGLSEVIKGFQGLAGEGRVEFTGSAAYHPLMPKIPKSEMERQIRLNEEINRKYFGKAWQPQGFFPPEMAYSPKVGEVVERLGYKWIILDESGLGRVRSTHFSSRPGLKTSMSVFKKRSSNLVVFFRNQNLSLKIAFSKITTARQLKEFFETEGCSLDEDSYIIVALDGETFGHHQPGQLKFLEEILEVPSSPPASPGEAWRAGKFQVPIKFVKISELFELFLLRKEIEPKESTWGESWRRWDDPNNPIHRLQWKLYKLALKEARVMRALLDRALHSDQFWWASHSPCWHPKMIERGARMLRDVVLLSPASPEKEKRQAQKLYNNIILTGRKLYGEEIIPC